MAQRDGRRIRSGAQCERPAPVARSLGTSERSTASASVDARSPRVAEARDGCHRALGDRPEQASDVDLTRRSLPGVRSSMAGGDAYSTRSPRRFRRSRPPSGRREAVRLSERSDDISQRGAALVDLATVVDRAGRVSEAATALRDAIALYGRKGNLVSAARAHTTLERPRTRRSRHRRVTVVERPHINAPARVWPSRREAGRPRGLEAENVSDCV